MSYSSPYWGPGDCRRCDNRGVVFTQDCGVCGGSGSAFGGSCGSCGGSGQARGDARTCPACHGKSVLPACPGCGCTPPLSGYLPDRKRIGCGVHGRGCGYVYDRQARAWVKGVAS